MQGIAFLSRPELHQATVADVLNQPFQNLTSQSGAGHFASAEKNGRLDLVAFIQKTQHVILLGLVVVIVDIDAELYFLDRDRLLMLLGLAFLLLLLVQVFPVIHDAANRRLRCGGNLDQIQVSFAGHLERFKRWQDADLLALVINHADFARSNTLICADKTLIDTNLPFTFNGVG
jgi:hypothetical protein